MRKFVKRAVALALALTMIIPFAGCGKGKVTHTIDKNAIYKETAYKLTFPDGFSSNSFAKAGENLFFGGSTYDEKGNSNILIYITDITGNILNKVALSNKNGWLTSLYAGSDENVYAIFTEYFEDASDPDNYIWEESLYIVKLDKSGKEIARKEMDMGEMTYVEHFIPGNDGGFIIQNGSTFSCFDKDMNKVKENTIDGISWIENVVNDKDGNTYLVYYTEDSYEMKRFDVASLTLGDKIDLPFSFYNYTIYQGSKGYDFYLKDSTCLYGYKLGDADKTTICNFVDSDITSNYFNALISNEDGSFLGCYSDWDDDGNYYSTVSQFTKVAPEDVVEKSVLTLGCTYLDGDVRKKVVNFNKANDSCRISIVDYSQYQTEENYMAGMEKLNSDIASGQGPDIILADNPSVINNYAGKGLFLDLYKYLDKDEEIDKNDIFPNLLKACEYNGKLVQIVSNFNIQTVIGKKSIVGDRDSWTFNDMLELEKTLPEGTKLFYDMTRESFLNNILSMDANFYVDMNKAKCNFDSQQFKDLLTYCATLPEGTDEYYETLYSDGNEYESAWRTNRVVLYPYYIYSVGEHKSTIYGYFDEEVSYIGYPAGEGNGSSLSFYNSYGISSRCAYPDEAWEFVKTCISPETQKTISWNIPASMSRFDEMAKEAMEPLSYIDEETGEEIFYGNTFYVSGEEIPLPDLTQDDVDKLKAFICSVDKAQSSIDEDIYTIINEETAPFFEGQKTVDEVASIIQSRVSIYINEKQ